MTCAPHRSSEGLSICAVQDTCLGNNQSLYQIIYQILPLQQSSIKLCFISINAFWRPGPEFRRKTARPVISISNTAIDNQLIQLIEKRVRRYHFPSIIMKVVGSIVNVKDLGAFELCTSEALLNSLIKPNVIAIPLTIFGLSFQRADHQETVKQSSNISPMK